MSATQPRHGDAGEKAAAVAVWAGAILLLLLLLVTNVAVRLAGSGPIPSNWFSATFAVLHVPGQPRVDWTTGCTLVAVGLLLLLVLPAVLGGMWWKRRHPRRTRVDVAARHMASGRELDRLTPAAAKGLAASLGARTDIHGVLIGDTIGTRQELVADWESSEANIWGPRTGKTTSRAVPAVLGAPGAVVATSNRRDLVDATRDARGQAGRVYVFDPQKIVGDAPAFYWDPLSYVLSGPAVPEVKSQSLSAIFAAAATHPDAPKDRFFDPKGEALLGHLLLAAAVSGKSMVDVYRWVNRETDTEPARLLNAAGYLGSAEFVKGIIGSPDKQRGGIYGTAELCVTWMTNRAAVEWILPTSGRPQFDPAEFALSADTLYLVSREGRGSLGALTAALTAAVCEAAEYLATTSHRGRLPVPMVVCLDEVANVCRWPDLPGLYSHYGGRGIYLLSILQSWKQGEDCWGARGMAQLWSAATVRIYGGGDVEVTFLDEMRRLIGSYRSQQVSSGHGRSGRTVNYSEVTDDILDVADLAALPRGRQVLVASGVRPALIACRPWYSGPWAEQVRASIARHDPAAAETLAAVPAVNPVPDVQPAGAAFRNLPGSA